jgi:hypothetical protein
MKKAPPPPPLKRHAHVYKVARESGIPLAALATMAEIYGLKGDPYAGTVTLAPHITEKSDSATYWKWYAYTWSAYLASKGSRSRA